MYDWTFHGIAIGIDILVLLFAYRFNYISSLVAALLTAIFAHALVGVFLAQSSFHGMRLVAYGWLFHLPTVALFLAIIGFRHKRTTGIALTLVSCIGYAIFLDALVIEPRWLHVTHYCITSKKLTRPIKLAIVADLQTDQVSKYEKKVFERLLNEKPDMVLFAGDYLQLDIQD